PIRTVKRGFGGCGISWPNLRLLSTAHVHTTSALLPASNRIGQILVLRVHVLRPRTAHAITSSAKWVNHVGRRQFFSRRDTSRWTHTGNPHFATGRSRGFLVRRRPGRAAIPLLALLLFEERLHRAGKSFFPERRLRQTRSLGRIDE